MTFVTVALQRLRNSRQGFDGSTRYTFGILLCRVNDQKVRLRVLGARISKAADITTPHVVEGSRNRVLAGSG